MYQVFQISKQDNLHKGLDMDIFSDVSSLDNASRTKIKSSGIKTNFDVHHL